MPKKITKWQCVNCNREFSSEQKCIAHEKREYDIERANEMLKGGDTLKEINNKFDF